MDPNSVSRVNWAINRRAEGLVSKHMADMAKRRSAVSEEDMHPLPGDLSRSAEDIPGRAEVNFSVDSQSYNPAGVAGKLMREDASSTSETAAHKQILSLLIEIKEEQQRQWEVLKDLQARIHGQVCEEEDEPLDVDLPLRTMEQLDETEQHLEDTEAQKRMVSHLSRMGGATVDDAVRRLMHAVLSFSVGSELNWVGRGQKRSFRNTRLQGVLFRALKRTPVGKEATHHQFADVVKKWLRFAPFRQRGSGRRPHWKPVEFICPKYDSTVEDHNQLNHNQLDSGEIQVTI
ncbi:uncharacterized protein LOC107718844 [Sinocyclocheilus rhinocerous]|uniref:Uncharacterized LOC107718844 n=1 Tax=Sinocyclocheilus rhinocerous TaxID=307959 RepID=A0A673IW23_9TELE|nr:PREDICTED: uncharacterized protein LOC107718844 [Sinocyclocheilus rhinocerous]